VLESIPAHAEATKPGNSKSTRVGGGEVKHKPSPPRKGAVGRLLPWKNVKEPEKSRAAGKKRREGRFYVSV